MQASPFKKATLKGHKKVTFVAFHPHDRTIVVAASIDGTIMLWDTMMGCIVRKLQGHTGAVWSVAFSPHDPTIIASAGADKTVILWNIASGKIIKTHSLHGPASFVTIVAFSPHNPTLIASASGYEIFLLDRTTGDIIKTLKGHTGMVTSVAFSPHDPATIASASRDQTVILWNTAGRIKHILKEHKDHVCSVAFSPHDPATIASAGADTTVILWNIASGNIKTICNGHYNPVSSVAFDPNDSAIIASASHNGTVILWNVEKKKNGKIKNILEGHHVAFDPHHPATIASASGDQAVLWDTAMHTSQSGSVTASGSLSVSSKSDIQDREIESLKHHLASCRAAILAKDAYIGSLTSTVNHLQEMLPGVVGTTPLPVWDSSARYLWNDALFPAPQYNRFRVFLPFTVAADSRLANLQHFFADLMATRGCYTATFQPTTFQSTIFQSNPVSDFKLDRFELLRHTALQSLFLEMEKYVNHTLAGNSIPEVEQLRVEADADAEKRALLDALKALFITQGATNKCNLLHVFHGARVEDVDSILENGLRPLKREDAGYFGHGCYTTPSIEYAARYASGELCSEGARAPDATGCWPVIMFTALVGVTYAVTRDADYATPTENSSYSKFFGKPLRGMADSHVVGVSGGNSFQASNDAATTDYLELVTSCYHLLPLAVLWLRPDDSSE